MFRSSINWKGTSARGRILPLFLVCLWACGCESPESLTQSLSERSPIANVDQTEAGESTGDGTDSIVVKDSPISPEQAPSAEMSADQKDSENLESPTGDARANQATVAGELVYVDQFPKVLAVKVKPLNDNRWQFNVTLSSPYDSRQRYADAWRVLDAQDNELGVRILGHHHAGEQPFTRSHVIELPAGSDRVFVEGRDQANGWSGQRFEVELP